MNALQLEGVEAYSMKLFWYISYMNMYMTPIHYIIKTLIKGLLQFLKNFFLIENDYFVILEHHKWGTWNSSTSRCPSAVL